MASGEGTRGCLPVAAFKFPGAMTEFVFPDAPEGKEIAVAVDAQLHQAFEGSGLKDAGWIKGGTIGFFAEKLGKPVGVGLEKLH